MRTPNIFRRVLFVTMLSMVFSGAAHADVTYVPYYAGANTVPLAAPSPHVYPVAESVPITPSYAQPLPNIPQAVNQAIVPQYQPSVAASYVRDTGDGTNHNQFSSVSVPAPSPGVMANTERGSAWSIYPEQPQLPTAQYASVNPPPPSAAIANAPVFTSPKPTYQMLDLGTRSGFEIGLQGSNYHYQEHVIPNSQFMRQNGIKVGATVSGTEKYNYGIFLTGEVRFAYSKNDYFSDQTGKVNSFADDFIGEGRLLLGKDFLLDHAQTGLADYDITPYLGVGFRDLYNDSSNSVGGYRRNSEYFYIPMGLTQRFMVANDARISFNAEYDLLLQGRQTSYLSDADPTQADIANDQNHGFGVRGSAMYEWNIFSVGPFINYWNVNQSVSNVVGLEPHNQTLEYGLQLRYRFR